MVVKRDSQLASGSCFAKWISVESIDCWSLTWLANEFIVRLLVSYLTFYVNINMNISFVANDVTGVLIYLQSCHALYSQYCASIRVGIKCNILYSHSQQPANTQLSRWEKGLPGIPPPVHQHLPDLTPYLCCLPLGKLCSKGISHPKDRKIPSLIDLNSIS